MDENNTALLEQRTELFRKAAGIQTASQNAYRGLAAHAKGGLHEHVASLAAATIAPGSTVLDMAAGSGAMSARLTDLGYSVVATDYVVDNFRASLPFVRSDLNGNFSAQFDQRFDSIVAMEIIEHLENPRHFLRECRHLLRPGGVMLLTTPNPDSPVSKALYIREGYPGWFSDRDYKAYGHISPLAQKQLIRCAQEAKFSIQLSSFGDAYELVKNSPRIRLLARLIEKIDTASRSLRGDITVAILRT